MMFGLIRSTTVSWTQFTECYRLRRAIVREEYSQREWKWILFRKYNFAWFILNSIGLSKSWVSRWCLRVVTNTAGCFQTSPKMTWFYNIFNSVTYIRTIKNVPSNRNAGYVLCQRCQSSLKLTPEVQYDGSLWLQSNSEKHCQRLSLVSSNVSKMCAA